MLLIEGGGCTDGMDPDDKPKGPLVVRNFWPVLPPASEAEILANRILRLESDNLLFDPNEWDERIEEIEQVLRLIRDAYPEIANIPARRTRALGQLKLDLESRLYQILGKFWQPMKSSSLSRREMPNLMRSRPHWSYRVSC